MERRQKINEREDEPKISMGENAGNDNFMVFGNLCSMADGWKRTSEMGCHAKGDMGIMGRDGTSFFGTLFYAALFQGSRTYLWHKCSGSGIFLFACCMCTFDCVPLVFALCILAGEMGAC
mgnify:CR=1 FL=1